MELNRARVCPAGVISRHVMMWCISLFLQAVVGATQTHGVAPEDAGKYSDTSGFHCLGGGPLVPREVVNDDFCDCPDGSDEPGTGACAGVEATSQKGFYCSNHGIAPRYLFRSRVGDGVCDCCDGSDEWQTGLCSDSCEAMIHAQKHRHEERRRAMEKGIEIRRKALEAAGSPEVWSARLSELKAQLPELEAAVKNLKAKRDDARTIFETTESSAVQGDVAVSVGEKTDESAAEKTGEKTVSEYAKWMEKDQIGEDSSGIERKAVDHQMLSVIKVRSGDLVDFIEFHYTKGEPLITGGGNGNEQEPFRLAPGEAVVEVRGGQGGLLDGVEFVTNKGRSSKRYGGSGGDAFVSKATEGMMIVGLERSEGTAGKIDAVLECMLVDPRSPEERALDDAHAVFELSDQQLQGAFAEMREMEARLSGDFRQDTRDVYSMLDEKCGSGHVDNYNYKICLFGKAEQGYTSLGTWDGWDSQEKGVAIFKDGQRCHSGIIRTLRVTLECGDTLKVLRIFEPSQCTYEATMTHPGACDFEDIDDKSFSSVRVLKAHEHDEL